jgi:hypothetical protein
VEYNVGHGVDSSTLSDIYEWLKKEFNNNWSNTLL